MTFNLDYDSSTAQTISFIRNDEVTESEFPLELDSDTNGTTEPFDGTQLYPKGTNVGINAVPNTDYRFDKWVINGKEVFNKITNVIMNNGVRAFANFLSTILRNIIISVSGNGTTTPAPDTYQEYNDQEFTVTAIPDNDETEFDKFNINGTETTDNPINITITEDLNIVAFFSTIGAYILNTFNYGIEKVVDFWYWANDSNSNTVQIKDTQVIILDNSSYINAGSHNVSEYGFQFDVTYLHHDVIDESYLIGKTGLGLNIRLNNILRVYIDPSATSFVLDVPLVAGNYYHIKVTYDNRLVSNNIKLYIDDVLIDQIDKTDIIINTSTDWGIGSQVGTTKSQGYDGLYKNVKLSSVDGNIIFDYKFQDAQGVIIKDQSGNGNDGNLISAVLDTAWGTKIDEAEPMLHQKGGSKYLVNEVVGTTATLANPSNDNVGDDQLGEWLPTSGWIINTDSSLTTDGVTDNNIINIGVVGNSSLKLVTFTISEYVAGSVNARFGGGGGNIGTSGLGEFKEFMMSGSGLFYLDPTGFDGTISNISIKEVTAITVEDFELEFYLQKNGGPGGNIGVSLSDQEDGTISLTNFTGYSILNLSGQQLGLYKSDGVGGLVALIQTAVFFLDINFNHKIKLIRQSGLFSLYAKGGTLGTEYVLAGTRNDSTYSEFKFVLLIGDRIFNLSHMSKDGYKYDVANFADVTGTYAVRNSIGVTTLLDADGNELEYPPNTMWNTGNKYKFPIGTQYSDIQQLQDKGIYIGTEPQIVDYDTINSLENDADITITKDVPNRVINNLKIKE